MAQNVDILLGKQSYTRVDYTALRAYVQRMPVQRIGDLYYSEDSPQLKIGLERFLLDMRADLIERCIENNPAAAQSLQHARAGGQITLKALDILIRLADVPQALPRPSDPIAQWVRPKTASALKKEGLHKVEELMALIGRRGSTWWRAIQRVGARRALVLEKWLQRNEASLGKLKVVNLIPTYHGPLVDLGADGINELPPLARIRLTKDLDGSNGTNRAIPSKDSLAKNDLEAISAYLSRYIDRPHSFRAATREIERFFFWCVLELRKAMSSVTPADCHKYREFLTKPTDQFVGPKMIRTSPFWRPFSTNSLKPQSQDIAIRTVQNMFGFLVTKHYLAGNPWMADTPRASGPATATTQASKAPPEPLTLSTWRQVISHLQGTSMDPDAVQHRTALAALLLLGEAGLLRSELVAALGSDLKWGESDRSKGALRVNGTKGRPRDVPLTQSIIDALSRHLNDRDLSLSDIEADTPLLAPVHLSHLPRTHERHADGPRGYTSDGIYKVVRKVLAAAANDLCNLFPEQETEFQGLLTVGPRTLRQFYESQLLAAGASHNEVQLALGHKPLRTALLHQST